jgi:hypothetical protein
MEVDSDSESEQAPHFNAAEWIGKLYGDVPAHVGRACEAARTLPSSVISHLPSPDISVTDFLCDSLPDILGNEAPSPKRPSSWFSTDPPNCGEEVVLYLNWKEIFHMPGSMEHFLLLITLTPPTVSLFRLPHFFEKLLPRDFLAA